PGCPIRLRSSVPVRQMWCSRAVFLGVEATAQVAPMSGCGLDHLAVAVDFNTANERVGDAPSEFASFVDAVSSVALHVVLLQRVGRVEVYQHDVGVKAGRQGALATPEAHGLGRLFADQRDDTFDGDATAVVSLGQHDGQDGFDTRAAGRGLPDAAVLAGNAAVDVIGCDRVDCAGFDTAPESVAIGRFAQRWVDLADRAAFPGDVVGQVVRAGF